MQLLLRLLLQGCQGCRRIDGSGLGRSTPPASGGCGRCRGGSNSHQAGHQLPVQAGLQRGHHLFKLLQLRHLVACHRCATALPLHSLLLPAVQDQLVLQAHGGAQRGVQQPGCQVQVALLPTGLGQRRGRCAVRAELTATQCERVPQVLLRGTRAAAAVLIYCSGRGCLAAAAGGRLLGGSLAAPALGCRRLVSIRRAGDGLPQAPNSQVLLCCRCRRCMPAQEQQRRGALVSRRAAGAALHCCQRIAGMLHRRCCVVSLRSRLSCQEQCRRMQ